MNSISLAIDRLLFSACSLTLSNISPSTRNVKRFSFVIQSHPFDTFIIQYDITKINRKTYLLCLTSNVRHVILYSGGDANMHTKDDKKKRNFTLRIKDEMHDRIESEASKLGISKNAFVSMVIHKTLNKGD